MSETDWRPPDDPDSIAAMLECTWHDEIPLARFMGIRVVSLDADGIRMHAPLEPNLNHMGTGFAGSISSLATLTGWAACQAMVYDLPACDAMVHDVRMRYSAPVRNDLEARCAFPNSDSISTFRARLMARGRAHVELTVIVESDGGPCAELNGRFVAIINPVTEEET